MRSVYLHGFASGAQSRKARAFEGALRAAGVALELPDLAQGDFEHLTISRQLAVIDRLLNSEPARLIGSSMGGYLAALYASQHPEVDRIALLAPAFGFAESWIDPKWRESGWHEFFSLLGRPDAAGPLRSGGGRLAVSTIPAGWLPCPCFSWS